MKKFLIIGRTGVGKSSFINTTFGVPLAKTDRFERCTTLVEYYCRNTAFGELTLIDTPGMAEEDYWRDTQYLKMIKDKVNLRNLDYMIYMSRLDETRFRPEEKNILYRINQELGILIWSNAVLILTFAASVEKNSFDRLAERRIQDISDYIKSLDRQLYSFNFKSISFCDNVISNWAIDCVSSSYYLNNL